MKYLKTYMLTSAAVLALGISPVMAHDFASHHNTRSHAQENAHKPFARHLSPEQRLDIKRYFEYSQREPCQNYRPAPEGFVKQGCALSRQGAKTHKHHDKKNSWIGNVINDYEIHFAFNSAKLDKTSDDILTKLVKDIDRYQPKEIVISGYTDTAGPADYNLKLSKERAQIVAQALDKRGVKTRIMDKKAYGEKQNAITTKDGVPLKENRRVVIEFHK